MCSLAVRRTLLLELGGLDEAFAGMFEDQVLYSKLGLAATTLVDPRPLALYRQHDRSACAQAVASGEWSRNDLSPSERRFVAWLRDFYTNHMSAVWNRQEHPASADAAIARVRGMVTSPTTRLYPARVQRLRTECRRYQSWMRLSSTRQNSGDHSSGVRSP